MAKKQYIIINGVFYNTNDVNIDINNRAFLYGDALFETMHSSGTSVQFFYNHINRLIKSMYLLKMEVPAKFTVDTLGLQSDIGKLLIKNKIHKGARIRLTVYRNSGGLYSPKTNEVSYLINVKPLNSDKYVFNSHGLKIDINTEFSIQKSFLSNIKSANALTYVLAGIYCKENNLDDCLLLNDKNNVVETVSSNVFFFVKNKLYTPPISDGCVDGIMRNKILEIAKFMNIKTCSDKSIPYNILNVSDEIFTTNAISGIKWVLAYKDRRYFNRETKLLLAKLNEVAFISK